MESKKIDANKARALSEKGMEKRFQSALASIYAEIIYNTDLGNHSAGIKCKNIHSLVSTKLRAHLMKDGYKVELHTDGENTADIHVYW